MKYLLSAATLLATAIAKDVVCLVNDEPVATVDLDTGVCPFELPSDTPVAFDFNGPDDYNVIYYYATVDPTRYYTDIVNEGLTINIPAKLLYGKDAVPYYNVSDSKSPASNSTEALRKRLLGKTSLYTRDAESEFVETVKSQNGTEVPGSSLAVVDPSAVSSAVSSGSEETVTASHTTVVTITSCSDNKCSETTVPGKETLTTVTVSGVETAFTTVCPLTEEGTSTETEYSTTYLTVTSCADNKCSETTVPAKETLTTVTVEGVETAYTTICPITEEPSASAPASTTVAPVSEEEYNSTSTQYVTSYVTITSCGVEGCQEKSLVESLTTVTVNGVETAFTTYCPVENATSTAAPSPVAPTSEAPVVSTAQASSVAPVFTPVSNSTVAPVVTPVSNSTTVAPVTSVPVTSPVTNGTAIEVSTVCTGEQCKEQDTTSTVQSTVIVSVSASSSAAAEVSTFEAGASNVNGVASVVALVGAMVYLL